MEPFQTQDLLEYVVDEYTDFDDIPFDGFSDSPKSGRSFDEDDDLDSDFEDDLEPVKFKILVYLNVLPFFFGVLVECKVWKFV